MTENKPEDHNDNKIERNRLLDVFVISGTLAFIITVLSYCANTEDPRIHFEKNQHLEEAFKSYNKNADEQIIELRKLEIFKDQIYLPKRVYRSPSII